MATVSGNSCPPIERILCRLSPLRRKRKKFKFLRGLTSARKPWPQAWPSIRESTRSPTATAWDRAGVVGCSLPRAWKIRTPRACLKKPGWVCRWPTSAMKKPCGWPARPKSTATSPSRLAPRSTCLARTFLANFTPAVPSVVTAGLGSIFGNAKGSQRSKVDRQLINIRPRAGGFTPGLPATVTAGLGSIFGNAEGSQRSKVDRQLINIRPRAGGFTPAVPAAAKDRGRMWRRAAGHRHRQAFFGRACT